MPDKTADLPQLFTKPAEISALVSQLRSEGKTIGLVPTMGALHQGHLSLAAAARRECDVVIAWIFVNPTQFAPSEDLDQYPRTLQADLEKLSQLGVEYVFAPSEADIYVADHNTFIEVHGISKRWEGEHRATHFRGVATIVLKMFLLIPADVAYFGQKDFQQCLVIQRMVADLNVPIKIEICPTIREDDGLAMSSRNAYLTATEREQALVLSKSLQHAYKLFSAGERSSSTILNEMQKMFAAAGITNIDYIAIADPRNLEPLGQIADRAVILIAVHLGQTRLIDNCLLGAKR